MTRFLNVPLDVCDVFIMTFMILQDSYMEPTRVGSDEMADRSSKYEEVNFDQTNAIEIKSNSAYGKARQ